MMNNNINIITSIKKNIMSAGFNTLALMTSYSFIELGIRFFVNVKLTHFFTAAEYGAIPLGLSFGIIVMNIIRFGADRVLVRDIIQQPENSDLIVSVSYFIRFIVAGIILAISFTFIMFSRFMVKEIRIIVFVYIINGIIMGLTPIEIFDSIKKTSLESLINFVINFSYNLICLILLYIMSHEIMKIIVIALLRLIASIINIVWQYIKIKEIIKICPIKNIIEKVMKMAKSGMIMMIPGLINVFMCNYPIICLGTVYSTEKLAPFGLAFSLSNMLTIAIIHLARIQKPNMAMKLNKRSSRYEIIRKMKEYIIAMLCVALPFCGIMYYTGEWFFKVFYPPTYLSGVIVLKILMAWVIIGWAIYIPVVQVGISIGLDRNYLYSSIGGALIAFISCSSFIHSMGIKGAAVSLLLANTISLLIAIVGIMQYFKKL